MLSLKLIFPSIWCLLKSAVHNSWWNAHLSSLHHEEEKEAFAYSWPDSWQHKVSSGMLEGQVTALNAPSLLQDSSPPETSRRDRNPIVPLLCAKGQWTFDPGWWGIGSKPEANQTKSTWQLWTNGLHRVGVNVNFKCKVLFFQLCIAVFF